MSNLNVFLNARRSDGLWNDSEAALYEPAKYDLSYSLPMTSRYRLETFIVEDWRRWFGTIGLLAGVNKHIKMTAFSIPSSQPPEL